MPKYDYECQSCHHRFEVKQSFASEPAANCPVCNNGARRLIHSVPVMFKGSGWYVNDHGRGRSTPSSSTESKDSEKDSDSKPKAESSSDSKAEAKGKTKAPS